MAYIGLALENAERLISEYWAAYESIKPEARQIATIKYPDRYSIKTDSDRIDESNKLGGLMSKVPGQTVKREIAKEIVNTLLGGKISVMTLEKIRHEIDTVPYTTSDANVIQAAVTGGFMSTETASLAIGCNEGEHVKAQKEHVERARAVAVARESLRALRTRPPASTTRMIRHSERRSDPQSPRRPRSFHHG